jgi:hypothetical protein
VARATWHMAHGEAGGGQLEGLRAAAGGSRTVSGGPRAVSGGSREVSGGTFDSARGLRGRRGTRGSAGRREEGRAAHRNQVLIRFLAIGHSTSYSRTLVFSRQRPLDWLQEQNAPKRDR